MLPCGVLTLSFAFYLSHRNDSSADDFFRASIVGPSGTTLVFEELGTAVNDAAMFTTRTRRPVGLRRTDDPDPVHAPATARPISLLEAAVDDVRIVVQ